LIPEGDFRARGRRETTVKAEAKMLKYQTLLSFAAITDRNQHSDNLSSGFIFFTLNSIRTSKFKLSFQRFLIINRRVYESMSAGLKNRARPVAKLRESEFFYFFGYFLYQDKK